jgi:hypothetical protein
MRHENLQNICYIHIYASILDYLLPNQTFHHRNPKDDVKHIIKPTLVCSYPMASAVNFPCKIYICSPSFGFTQQYLFRLWSYGSCYPVILLTNTNIFEGKCYLYFQSLNSVGIKNVICLVKYYPQINLNCEVIRHFYLLMCHEGWSGVSEKVA